MRETRYARSLLTLVLVGVFLFSVAVPLIPVPHVSAATVLTPKWTRSGLGTNWEGGLVIGDVTGDGQEDVVYGGNDNLVVLNGDDGTTIASYSQSRIGQYCQPQLYDVDADGVLDILVPLYYLPGLAAVKYVGTATLSQMWICNTEGASGSGSVMAKPVAGDINNDGQLDIFIGSQDVSPLGGYDGTIVRLDYLGNILYTTFTWRPCSGGLSLADTDNDGVFELYQGDRDMDYSDGGYGKGVKSYWADNLTERWIRLDDLTSSQAPVLADVNGDGVKDVITGMYRVMWVLNSTNGAVIKYWSNNALSVHYGFTVSDIDADGNLELLCSDGDHDNDRYVDVFDLVTGQMDAELFLGNYTSTQVYDEKWGPLVADIYDNGNNPDGTPRMEIITGANTTRVTTYSSYPAKLLVFDNQYNLLQNITGLQNQIGYPFVQDIDDDGFLELVVIQNNGVVRAYDASKAAPSGSQRIRSDITYFGESRLGVAEHTIMPWEANYWTAPLVAPVSPGDNALAVPRSTTQLSFRLREHQNQSLTYSVTCSPNVGSTSGSITTGTYNWNTRTVSVSGLAYDTTYRWTVTANDGTKTTTRTYTFRTQQDPNSDNNAPTQGTPVLVPSSGGTTTTNFQCLNQSTEDIDGDPVTNIYRWTVNSEPVAQLLLPFDTRGEGTTADYSGFDNDGKVIGAAWVPNGRVGGAYLFDGKDDAIVVSDGGLGYFDDKDYSSNNEELGGFGNWDAVTVEAWIYLTKFNNGSRIVAKIPSYAIGFDSGRTNRLYGAVWPYTGEVSDDENAASVDRMQRITADVSITLNTWYHIAFTYQNGTGMRLYFNGVQVATGSSAGGRLSPSRGEPVYIGRLVQPFAGMIDDVRVYNYMVPAVQILNRYNESKNGLSSSSVFQPIVIAAPYDTLGCDVIPTDSYDEGTTRSVLSGLGNSAPAVSDLRITPLRDRAFRLDNEDLVASYLYSDPDGNAESGSQIRWYRNGELQTAFNDLDTVPAASTSIGQDWYYTVTPRDSLGTSGALNTSETVTIRGNSAPSTGTPTLDSTNGGIDYDDEDIVGTALGTSDADLDPTTDIYHFIRGGTSMTNLQLPFDTEVPLVPGTNGVTKDYSGYGNNGMVNGSAWVQDGVIGGALSFDGNDYVRVQESGTSLGGSGWSEISVEFWANATGATSSETVILKHDELYSTGGGGGGSSYGVGYRVDYRSYATGYRVYWYVYNATALQSVNLQVNEGPGQWHHVVCTYESGAGLKLYTDGQLRATMAATGNINATSDGLLSIGGLGSASGDFIGQLDEVRIYPKVLSEAQILQRYTDTMDGASDSETIVAQETAAGDTWVCQVTPNDSWVDGTPRTSDTLNVVPANVSLYNLNITVEGHGSTSPAPGLHEYGEGSLVQVDALPNAGYRLDHWLLNGGDVGSTDPYTVTVSGDTTLVAVFVSDTLFEDDYESGSFSAWTGTSVTSGETATVVSTLPHGGTYAGMFTSNTDTSTYERAYGYWSPTALSELYVRGYIRVAETGFGASETGDRLYLFMLIDGSNPLVYAGLRQTASGPRWIMMLRTGPTEYPVSQNMTAIPSVDTWYCVELHWKRDASTGLGELWVDGVLVCSITDLDTTSYGGANRVRFGIAETTSCANTVVYGDDVKVSASYIGVGVYNPKLAVEGSQSWNWGSDTRVNSVSGGDVDGDGAVETVTGGYYYDGVRKIALLHIWSGSSLAPERSISWFWGGDTEVTSTAVGDVDGDGAAEIVTGGYYFDGMRNVAQLHVWNGSTLAVENVQVWYWGSDTVIQSLAIGNVDGDGQQEIVTGGYYFDGTRNIALLHVWNGASLAVENVQNWYWGDDTQIMSVAVGDVDGDTQIEIVTGGSFLGATGNHALLHVWNGASLAVENVQNWIWGSDTVVKSICIDDVDGDGAAEIVTGGSFSDGVSQIALLHTWSGSSLAVEDSVPWLWSDSTEVISVASADVDGDGQTEIVTGGRYYDGAKWIALLHVWDGDTLACKDYVPWYWSGSTIAQSLWIGNVDADGQTEIVTGGYFTYSSQPNAQLIVWTMAS